MKSTPPSTPRRRGKRIALFAAMLAVSAVIALVLGEIALRLFPIPGIIFHNFYYDPVTGGKYYPSSTVMFRGDDGVLIRRSVNSWGFPDVEHALAAPSGTLRIGFFGDSYTEALQVPIEQTFFRLIENDLDLRVGKLARMHTRDGKPVNSVEALAFGMSGRSAVQSYMECKNWMDRTNLDYVVYVFVENDVADNLKELKVTDISPYAALSGDSFIVDTSFNEKWKYKTSWWHRTMQRIKSNSLVVSTIEGRLKLLKAYGVKREVTPADRAGAAGGGGTPMALSAWPPELVADGWELQRRIMERWRSDVEAQGRKFVVMHVPRGPDVLRRKEAEQDSWTSRLHAFCGERNIPLVEPAPLFVARMDAGEKMYHNHFTPEGHRAFAEAFVRYFVGDKAAR